jgi:GT2 family glycosyltransferase
MISFIIPYRQKDNYRARNLNYLIARLKSIQILESEIIVVEHDQVERYKNPEVKKIFIQNDSVFNKSACLNAGAKASNHSFLFFNDCDIVMENQNYKDALLGLIDYDVVNPYSSIRYFNQDNTRTVIKTNNFETYDRIVKPSIISGGAFLIRKSVFNEVGGFDEACMGFGYEDTIFDLKLLRLGYKILTLNNYSMHLYHPAGGPTPTDSDSFNKYIIRLETKDEYYRNFKNNKKLYESYEDMTIEQLKQKINETHT